MITNVKTKTKNTIVNNKALSNNNKKKIILTLSILSNMREKGKQEQHLQPK